MRAAAVSAFLAAFLAAATLAAPAAADGLSDPQLAPHLVRDIGEPGHQQVLHCDGICQTAFGSLPEGLVPAGERLFFTAGSAQHGRSLWVTDGSETGTRRMPFAGHAIPLHAIGDRLVFLRSESEARFLAITDGTAAGTHDLASLGDAGLLLETAASEGVVYVAFEAALWRSDGTLQGTREIEGGSFFGDMASARGRLFARGGRSVWEIAADGAVLPAATLCAEPAEGPDLEELLALGGDVYFFAGCVAGAEDGAGTDLYRLDLDTETVHRVADRVVPAWSPTPFGGTELADTLGLDVYFNRRGADGVLELWRTGPGGLERVAAPLPGLVQSVASAARGLLLGLRGHGVYGVVDGRPVLLVAGADLGLDTLGEDRAAAASPWPIRAWDGLWQSDGTPQGTRPVAGSPLPSFNDQAEPPAIAGGRYYFAGEQWSGTGTSGIELWAVPLPSVHGCVEAPTRHCLADGRFAVSVSWRDPRSGDQGAGRVAGRTADSGFFWFFDRDNVELLVKVLDARAVDGRHWVFHGSLTDVAYTVRVEDLATGEVRTYERPAASLCGGADTAAFGPEAPAAAGPSPPAAGPPERGPRPGAELHLGDGGRFAVAVEWLDPASGLYRPAAEVETSRDAGWAWFFDPANVEVFVKVLDATQVNGRHWVFHGGLTDLGYRVTVADRLSGVDRVYVKAPGSLCGGADTAAF